MSSYFSASALKALEITAATAAAYLDACDSGARHVRLDPGYYQQCGKLLWQIFRLADPARDFPSLLAQSAAARNARESIAMGQRIELSRLGYYPELALTLFRASA